MVSQAQCLVMNVFIEVYLRGVRRRRRRRRWK
jgi:hypothetical protein